MVNLFVGVFFHYGNENYFFPNLIFLVKVMRMILFFFIMVMRTRYFVCITVMRMIYFCVLR